MSGSTVSNQFYAEFDTDGLQKWIIYYDVNAGGSLPTISTPDIRYDFTYTTLVAYYVGDFINRPWILIISTTLKSIIQKMAINYNMVQYLDINSANNNIYSALQYSGNTGMCVCVY